MFLPAARLSRHTFRREAVIACTVFIAAFVYLLPEATALIDDHFMHVAWGRQLLYGRQPLRDMEALGMPLQAALSALSESVVGYRLLSEGLIVSTAFASAAALTFVLARRASKSSWIGAGAAAVQLAASPRTYGYPKLLAYTAAIALLWRYVDAPTRRRAAGVGVAVAVAFLLRHDHGLYTGLVSLAIIGFRQRADWRTALSHVCWFGGLCALTLTPYLAYVQHHRGLTPYLQDLRTLAVREHQQNGFHSLPRWPLSQLGEIVQWRGEPMRMSTIGVHAKEASSGETDAGPRQGLQLGSIHLLAGLDTPFDSAALLFFATASLLTMSAIALLCRRTTSLDRMHAEGTKIAVVVLIGLVTSVGFIREPLAIRMPDAIAAPAILAAWWTGRVWFRLRNTSQQAVRYAAIVMAGVLVLLIGRSVAVVGAVPTRLARLTQPSTISKQLFVTPADVGTLNNLKASAVRYIRACTQRSDPLLVLWFAPDLYYFSDRPFAGRLGFYMEGYWASHDAERLNIAAIERDRPTLALIESGREATDLYTYPHLLAYIADRYHPLGALPSSGGRSIQVFARNDRAPSSIDARLGWPCYA